MTYIVKWRWRWRNRDVEVWRWRFDIHQSQFYLSLLSLLKSRGTSCLRGSRCRWSWVRWAISVGVLDVHEMLIVIKQLYCLILILKNKTGTVENAKWTVGKRMATPSVNYLNIYIVPVHDRPTFWAYRYSQVTISKTPTPIL